jgi:hypothetical protein
MSAAFERFKFSFFEDPKSAQDALDTRALEALQGEERERAEDMLIAFLPDSRGVIGLGVLRSRRAKPHLVKLFEAERQQLVAKSDADKDWYPFGLLYLARALWRIDPNPRWPAAAIDVLESPDWLIARQEAAEALYGVRDPAAAQALNKALDDPEPLVRYHAARSLLEIYGLPAEPFDPHAMTARLMSKDAARRATAKHDILAAIAGRQLPPP